MPKETWKDAVIKALAVVVFFVFTAWATWGTNTLLSMKESLSSLDSLKRNWTLTGRNKERIAEFHGADPNPPKFERGN